MIKAKKEEIFKLFRTASILSFSGNPDNGAVLQEHDINLKESKQGQDIDRTPFDAMMEVLSVPAMRARYFVARLVDRKRTCTLHVAAAEGQTDLVKVLLDKGANSNARNVNWPWWPALHDAASNGHIEVVKVLLDRGAGTSIDVPQMQGNTVLHVAAQNRHAEVVKLLLKNGAKTDLRNTFGKTALDIARGSDWADGVKLPAEGDN